MRLQVIDWNDYFENNKSREINKCSFVCTPNKQDGMGLLRVLNEPDGAAIYGIWGLIIGAASRQSLPRSGHLTRPRTVTKNDRRAISQSGYSGIAQRTITTS